MLVISPMSEGAASATGRWDDINVDDWYEGRAPINPHERVIEIVLDIPIDFFEPIQLKGELKTQVTQIFAEFIEEHNDEA